MATFESDLGKVTAYAYAVDAGYQGTEAEFEEDLLNAVSTFTTDKTLTIADKAADSSVTGQNIAEVRSGVSEIKDELDAAFTKTQSANLLNPENITVGKFYKTQVGEDGRSHMVMSDNAAFSCAYVDIITGESYISTGINYNAYTGDTEGYATGIAANASSSLAEPIFNTTARNSQYNNSDKAITRLYISWRHATYPTDTYMLVNGTTLPGEYVPYESSTHLAENIKVDYSQIENVPASDGEIYTVDPSGAGDYTTFTMCIKALRDNTNNKTIYVKAGTYDIFEEIGGQAYCESITGQGMTWMEANDLIPPHTKIIGIGEVIFKFLPEEYEIPSDVATLLSPLNITHDIYMENITVIADNCRYGIHDDTLANGDTETRHIYKNVRVNHGYSNAMGMKPAFGCGTNRGQYMEFDSCIFESTDRAFSFHNRGTGGAEDNTLIVVKNCAAIVDANQRAFWFGNVNGYQALVDVRIMSSYIDGKIVAGNESSGTERPNAFKLTLVGCGNPTIEINNATNIYTPTVLEIA